jgi:hypothetical protein
MTLLDDLRLGTSLNLMRLAAPVRRRPSQIVRGPLHMPLRLEPVANPV